MNTLFDFTDDENASIPQATQYSIGEDNHTKHTTRLDIHAITQPTTTDTSKTSRLRPAIQSIEISVYSQDIVFKKKYRTTPRMINYRDYNRGEVKEFTYKSRHNLWILLRHLRSPFFATLTFPEECVPRNGDSFGFVVDKLTRVLTNMKCFGVIVKEFGEEDGRPHLHLVCSRVFVQDEIEKLWRRVLGMDPSRISPLEVHATLVYAENRLWTYLCKQEQKCLPEGFGPAGRWWTKFGKNLMPQPKKHIGLPEKMNPIVRATQKVEVGRNRRKGINHKPKKRYKGYTVRDGIGLDKIIERMMEENG